MRTLATALLMLVLSQSASALSLFGSEEEDGKGWVEQDLALPAYPKPSSQIGRAHV